MKNNHLVCKLVGLTFVIAGSLATHSYAGSVCEEQMLESKATVVDHQDELADITYGSQPEDSFQCDQNKASQLCSAMLKKARPGIDASYGLKFCLGGFKEGADVNGRGSLQTAIDTCNQGIAKLVSPIYKGKIRILKRNILRGKEKRLGEREMSEIVASWYTMGYWVGDACNTLRIEEQKREYNILTDAKGLPF